MFELRSAFEAGNIGSSFAFEDVALGVRSEYVAHLDGGDTYSWITYHTSKDGGNVKSLARSARLTLVGSADAADDE